jgi:glycosyltransferase involved in cell wall biosynthesis
VTASATQIGDRDAIPSSPSSGHALTVVYIWDADYPWDVRTEKVCAALVAAGHDVHIVARNKRRASLVERLAEGTVHRMPPWRWAGAAFDRALSFPAFFSPRWRSFFGSVLRAVRPDVIIVRDLPLCPLAISVGRRHGVPVILDMAENYAAMMQETWDAGRQKWFDGVVRNPKFVVKVEQHCLRHIDHVLTVVEESSDRIIAEGLPAIRADVVSNTPPCARARDAAARDYSDHQPLHLVYLGLMEIPRGVEEVLDAVAMLSDKGNGRSIRLTLIGGGRDEQIFRDRAVRLGLKEIAEFHGYVQNKKALELVATADVGLVPHHANDSWNSTIPNKLFDYMAAGLPVISSDAIPCARVVRETQAGEVFRSRDAADLARAIERFFDASARRACGEAGRKAILERHNWEASTAILLRVVSETAAKGARAK